ncbi:dynamin-related protein 3A isoform X1 [Selaginella moellendorffii]|uniref:dynamin-related protein 3A isoform X1 n=1 Tax=Selaginella moellendorffii TaxID=88036 RepID=UPI000D1C26F3|nr:dynamin-related protein 3A isoform X1 [Selaginella moellendorffii]|eukprot:XP_024529684.1 dynamin-related protein 3A isoform X1 [Selaginella moellendorffii]
MDQGVTSTPPSPSTAAAAPPLGQNVIPLVNKLQDIFSQLGSASTIDLPQVAVVGSQSSGKSSVLEALVGRDFLPRGCDICTRRPLVLQLVQTTRRGDEVVEWGEFLHLPNRRFTDFTAIRKEIQAETDRELGSNKGISDKQIRLKIFSPKVLNITLVDLPGITKVPVGDQPTDIEARIRTMILSYIKHETCIILAVSPANADLANSDALQMARIADPDGSRTIGVITKLDIMDRGTDARNFLLGSVIPLRLGYIGVVNRSQEDITSNRSIQDALMYEEQFFRSRPVYHSLSDRCGIPQLAKKLNQILVQHIRTILPDLKARINTQMVTLQKELATYGELTESKNGQGVLLLGIITKYSQSFSSVVDGKNEEMSTVELSGGARIHYIFQSIFVKSLDEVDPCDDLTDEDIRTAIQNATGPKNVLFVPEVPFEVLVRRQIARLLEPSLQCARFIYDELVKISHRCESSELQRFPVLRRNIEEVIASFLREGLSPAETMIGHLIEMEMDYINTSHPGFIGGSKAVELALQQQRGSVLTASNIKSKDVVVELAEKGDKGGKARAILARNNQSSLLDHVSKPANQHEKPHHTEETGIPSGTSWGISSIFGDSRPNGKDANVTRVFNEPIQSPEPTYTSIRLREPPLVLRASDAQTEQESTEIVVTRLLLKSYYDIVRKNIQDSVPKAIMHFLVNHAKRELHNVFIRKLYREAMFEELLQEREEIAIKRKRCKEVLKVLQQAAWTIEELPLEYEFPSRATLSASDATGLPSRLGGVPAVSNEFYSMGSPKASKPRKSSSLDSSGLPNSNLGNGSIYPTIKG